VLRIKAVFKAEEKALMFQSDLDLLSQEVPFSFYNLTVVSAVVPVAQPSSLPLVRLLMCDYNHGDEEDSPNQTNTHSMTSVVPNNDDLVMFQSLQAANSFGLNCAEKAHIVDKAVCRQDFPSLTDCSDNFLALSAELHNQFDGRSVNPRGVPLFVIIPEEIDHATTISSSLSSKLYTTVKVCIYFYSDEAYATIASRFKLCEHVPNHHWVHMCLFAAHPELFVQCLNWKGAR
jgi:hypothetical protein